MNTSEQFIVENLWRTRVDTMAERMSDGKWLPYHWIKEVLRAIQDEIEKGGARIIINVPPRHGKSEGISHWLSTWFLERNPEKQILLGSYGDAFASKWGLKVRDDLERNPLTWSNVRKDKKRVNDWLTTENGGMRTVGVGGAVTGTGGDLLLIDDPHKDFAEAMSPTMRKKVIEWFDATFFTRAEPGASVVVIMTRWHEKDLTGYLVDEHSEDWIHLSLPALAEENDPLGRAEGEALCPERYTAEALLKLKKSNEQVFAGLFQQRPAPRTGNIIQRDWFRRYRIYELPVKPTDVTVSWDMSFKDTGTSMVVGTVWWQHGANIYLLHIERGKMDFPKTLKKVLALNTYCRLRWGSIKETLIEDKANGSGIISSIKDTIQGVIPINPSGSKEARLANTAPLFEAGNIWIPEDSEYEWVKPYIEELVTFPMAEFDDQADSTSQALNRMRKHLKTEDMDFGLGFGLGVPEWRL